MGFTCAWRRRVNQQPIAVNRGEHVYETLIDNSYTPSNQYD
jgi:hypothetical protein